MARRSHHQCSLVLKYPVEHGGELTCAFQAFYGFKVQQLEQEGARNYTGKVEKHVHLFEVILGKVLDQGQPKNCEEYEQCGKQ